MSRGSLGESVKRMRERVESVPEDEECGGSCLSKKGVPVRERRSE